MMPFLPASRGMPQPSIAQCTPFSFTLWITGSADGAAGGVINMAKTFRSVHAYTNHSAIFASWLGPMLNTCIKDECAL